MAVINRNQAAGGVTLSTPVPCPAHRPSGLVAGEAIERGQACQIKVSGGKSKVFLASGAAADSNAKVRGFAADDAAIGQGVTLLRGVHLGGYSGLTPGQDLYLAATAGELDTAATTGGTTPIAYAWDDQIIHVGPGL